MLTMRELPGAAREAAQTDKERKRGPLSLSAPATLIGALDHLLILPGISRKAG
jgi:hypothetical protein